MNLENAIAIAFEQNDVIAFDDRNIAGIGHPIGAAKAAIKRAFVYRFDDLMLHGAPAPLTVIACFDPMASGGRVSKSALRRGSEVGSMSRNDSCQVVTKPQENGSAL